MTESKALYQTTTTTNTTREPKTHPKASSLLTSVKSFVGSTFIKDADDIKEAVEEATRQADEYLEEVQSNAIEERLAYKIISTSTQALEVRGGFFHYIITLTVEHILVDEE